MWSLLQNMSGLFSRWVLDATTLGHWIQVDLEDLGCLAQAHFADLQSPGEGISRRQARQLRIWVNFYDLEMVWN